MNKVVLVGRLVKDVDLKATEPNGKFVASGTLAVNRDYKNQQGEREADFPRIVIWGKQAEVFATHVKKGHQVAVEGRLNTRSYGEEGNKTYVTEVIVDGFTFLEKKSA